MQTTFKAFVKANTEREQVVTRRQSRVTEGFLFLENRKSLNMTDGEGKR